VPQLVLACAGVKVKDCGFFKALLAVPVVQDGALAPNNLWAVQLAEVH
jgi:hypothetical protein